MSLASSYRTAARVARREARNFYLAFLTLPRGQRRAVYALYAFFREADDVADGAFPDPQPDATGGRRAGIEALRKRLAAAVAGSSFLERDLALADAIERFAIKPSDLEDVLTGVESDLGTVEMQTMNDLECYAYLVASAVGLAALAVLNDGVPPSDAMRERAIRFGLGMQLINVVRDVREDAAAGRLYVPREVLRAHGADPMDLRSGRPTEAVCAALADIASRACEHLAAGRALIPSVPGRSRACLWLLAETYDGLLRRIERAGYDVFSSRIGLPTAQKLWLVLRSLWRR
ncbi:MAG: phytoene/squalene synthase family protein [Candidatus Bipolaricaulota bacterium]